MVFRSGLCWSESLVGVFGFWWGLRGFFWSLPCYSLWAEGRDFWFSYWGLFYSIDLSCLFGVMGGLRCVFGGSGVLSQGAGSLCDFLVCLGIPW